MPGPFNDIAFACCVGAATNSSPAMAAKPNIFFAFTCSLLGLRASTGHAMHGSSPMHTRLERERRMRCECGASVMAPWCCVAAMKPTVLLARTESSIAKPLGRKIYKPRSTYRDLAHDGADDDAQHLDDHHHADVCRGPCRRGGRRSETDLVARDLVAQRVQPRRQKQFMCGVMTVPLGRCSST